MNKVIPGEWVQHPNAIWQNRANSVATVFLPPDDKPLRFEQLPLCRVDADTFEVCAMPFFARDIFLGDVVRLQRRGEYENAFESVVSKSRFWGIRVFIPNLDAFPPAGLLRELSPVVGFEARGRLLAIAFEGREVAARAVEILSTMRDGGGIYFETGWS